MSLFQKLVSQNGLYDSSFFSDIMGFESNTQIDWKETRNSHIFEIDLPGFTKEDLNLELRQDRVIFIRAERKEHEEEEEKKNLTWHCRERVGTSGVFSREFRLPENSKLDDIKASMRDGVLSITVAKDESKKKKHKSHKKVVHISQDDEEQEEHGVGAHNNNNNKGIGHFVCCKA